MKPGKAKEADDMEAVDVKGLGGGTGVKRLLGAIEAKKALMSSRLEIARDIVGEEDLDHSDTDIDEEEIISEVPPHLCEKSMQTLRGDEFLKTRPELIAGDPANFLKLTTKRNKTSQNVQRKNNKQSCPGTVQMILFTAWSTWPTTSINFGEKLILTWTRRLLAKSMSPGARTFGQLQLR